MVPWQWKDLVRRILDTRQRRRVRQQRSQIRKARTREPIVSFGGVLDDGRMVRGGAVKLLTLWELSECDEQCFNILYLVSSAQPAFVEDLVAECSRKAIRVVWNQNGVGYTGWAGTEAGRHNAPMRRLRTAADFVIYQSAFCRLSAEKFLGPVTKPSAVLLNPVDLDRFRPDKEALRGTAPRLLAMGTHSYRERVFSVLEALYVLRAAGISCTLTVAGPLQWRGAEAEARHEVVRLGLRDVVSFLPIFSHRQAPEIYRRHDILVHPKYMDPCPTVVVEALASGLPVVASESGGLVELTDPQCAELIPAPLVWDRLITPTGTELADAVRVIWERHDKASTAARARAELLFNGHVWAVAHRDIFNTLLF